MVMVTSLPSCFLTTNEPTFSHSTREKPLVWDPVGGASEKSIGRGRQLGHPEVVSGGETGASEAMRWRLPPGTWFNLGRALSFFRLLHGQSANTLHDVVEYATMIRSHCYRWTGSKIALLSGLKSLTRSADFRLWRNRMTSGSASAPGKG